MSEERTITIDGKEYNAADLSEDLKAQLVSMRTAEQELNRLRALGAITETARNAYAKAIKAALENVSPIAKN
jgi:hypothetical protein